MKLDASREFENLTSYVSNIKRSADLIGDQEVLIDLVKVLALLIQGLFLDLRNNQSASEQALLETAFDKQLELHELKRKEVN